MMQSLWWNQFDSFSQFQEKRQLGGDEIMQPFRNKLANDIEMKYKSFKQENEGRRNNFVVSAQLVNAFLAKNKLIK